MSVSKNLLTDICPIDYCTGCMACYNICPFDSIKMITNDEGFLYPQIDQKKCTNCQLCKKVCPSKLKKFGINDKMQKPEIYAAWSLNSEIRIKSSSGGVFFHLAEVILSQNGVVFGAGYDDSFHVIHKYINTIESYSSLQGSKYVQSFIGNTYQETLKYLQDGRDVLFSGTPCQIAGLKNFLLGKDVTHLYTVDLLCHGVPSPMVFDDFKRYLENKYNSSISNIIFKDKKTGWKEYSLYINFSDGSYDSKLIKESPFLNFFLSNLILRECCYQCQYACMQRQGDISLCDFWGYRPHSIDEYDDDRGISGIIVNSAKGKYMLQAIKKYIYFSSRSINELLVGQTVLSSPSPRPKNKDIFWKEYKEYGFSYVIEKYNTRPVDTSDAVKKMNKFKQNYQVLVEWFIKKQQNISITDYFHHKNYHKIAIYGMGELGIRLIDELEHTDIKVVFGIDKNCLSPYNGITIINSMSTFEDVDVIIVSVITAFDTIKKNLQYYTNCPIISLKDLIKSL